MVDRYAAVLYLLVALFGSSSWLSVNSIWMELSLLTQDLPEGWSLPSYLAAVIQIACIGPVIYSLIHKCTRVTIHKASTILILLIFCTMLTLLLAFSWNWTFVFLGGEHSVALITITFFMALVNATSNVLFMPYMAAFHPQYLTAYFVGMGFSALVPSIVSLIQGTMVYECVPAIPISNGSHAEVLVPKYSPARFHVQTFNLIMFVWMCLSTMSFVMLHWFVPTQPRLSASARRLSATAVANADERAPLQDKPIVAETRANVVTSDSSGVRYWILLFCLALVCAQMNSVLPSVQSYASLSYSLLTYHLALSLANLFHPIACFAPLWIKTSNTTILVSLTILTSALGGLIVILALQSPTPMLHGSVWGASIPIITSILTAFLNSYLRTVLTSVVREGSADNESRLFWCGVVMQIGSFLGACVMFPLVNFLHVFQPAKLC
ncbi:riboflavin transporter 2 [Ditylenchus destructor]|nr:riboflavin transporter 2 [Ditylenchus destructor]